MSKSPMEERRALKHILNSGQIMALQSPGHVMSLAP